jgi:LDH2 family malate/lactate/ureidoglycolate dehydrogenase
MGNPSSRTALPSALLTPPLTTGFAAHLITLNAVAQIAIEKVRNSGMAIVGLRNNWFAGRNGFYLEKIARTGFAAVYFGISTPTVVPPGAARKALGTNPLAIALPGKPQPFIFDMGTSSVMSGELLLKALLNEHPTRAFPLLAVSPWP